MADKSPEWLQHNDDGSVDITLARPILLDGAKTPTIRMREPTVSDHLAADNVKGSEFRKEVTFFANLCELTDEDVKGLTFRDYTRLQTAMAGFTD